MKRQRRTARQLIASVDPLYRFEWARDQHGYEIKEGESSAGSTSLLGMAKSHAKIFGRGGPPAYYRPLEEHPGLWRQFAEHWTSPEAAIIFANKFGLPSDSFHGLDSPRDRQDEMILSDSFDLADSMRHLIGLIDANDRNAAIDFFNSHWRGFVSMQILDGAVRPVPLTLWSAMQIQAAESLMGNQEWRRCKNPACPNPPFRIGLGYTKRRVFCCDRCRIAANRLDANGGE
jgi:hypothetical protein